MSDKINNTTSINVKKNNAEQRAQQLRNDPVVNRISKLGVNGIPERSDKYVASSSIQSMFSPGRYLCELYNVARELHKKDDPLHIDQRRPDIKDFSLNQVNMEKEVSTLDILLETLKTKVSLDDLATYDGEFDDNSFTLPYNDNLTIINAVLESKSTSLRNIATLLTDNLDQRAVKLTPALVQEKLGLNPASYELVKTELMSGNNSPRLAHATKLPIDHLGKLVIYLKNQRETSAGIIKLSEEQIIAVLSEYVRLNHQYSLSVEQFSTMIGSTDQLYTSSKKIFSRILGLDISQTEMLLTLCEKPMPIREFIINSDIVPNILATFNQLENILQWMSEQKLDLPTLQAMLTDKYSATATPELFNFLSNIYHSMDKSADEKLLKQNLCRSLAAGFHLKIEVIAGLVSWLESNDPDFTAQKFNQAVIQVFGGSPTLDTLEHHPQLVTQCQKLSQYVLIAQWAKLTQQDIELLLQPKLINGSEYLLHPSLSLLCLLAEFKAWQQQVKVPVSEAFLYFSLFGTHTDMDTLQREQEGLEKQLAEEINKLKPIDDKRKQISDELELSNKPLHDLNIEIKKIESSIKEKNILVDKLNVFFGEGDTIDLIIKHSAALVNINFKERKKYIEEREKLTSDLKVKNEKKKTITLKILLLNNSLDIINSDQIIEDVAIEALKRTINNNKKRLNELTQPEERMLAKIHGWDNQQMDDMIKEVFTRRYPTDFISVNKLCKHINIINQLKVTNKDLLNLKSLALQHENKHSIIKETAEGLRPSL